MTVQSKMITAVAALGVAAIGYCVYFDHKRRNDPKFRENLIAKRKLNQVSKKNTTQYPDMLNEVETQKFFMNEISLGEQLLQNGEIESGIEHLANAAAVTAHKQNLLNMLSSSLPEPVFGLLCERLPIVSQKIYSAQKDNKKNGQEAKISEIIESDNDDIEKYEDMNAKKLKDTLLDEVDEEDYELAEKDLEMFMNMINGEKNLVDNMVEIKDTSIIEEEDDDIDEEDYVTEEEEDVAEVENNMVELKDIIEEVKTEIFEEKDLTDVDKDKLGVTEEKTTISEFLFSNEKAEIEEERDLTDEENDDISEEVDVTVEENKMVDENDEKTVGEIVENVDKNDEEIISISEDKNISISDDKKDLTEDKKDLMDEIIKVVDEQQILEQSERVNEE